MTRFYQDGRRSRRRELILDFYFPGEFEDSPVKGRFTHYGRTVYTEYLARGTTYRVFNSKLPFEAIMSLESTLRRQYQVAIFNRPLDDRTKCSDNVSQASFL